MCCKINCIEEARNLTHAKIENINKIVFKSWRGGARDNVDMLLQCHACGDYVVAQGPMAVRPCWMILATSWKILKNF